MYMSASFAALVALVASIPMATTMAFVVPTGIFLGSVPGAEQRKQARPVLRRLAMAIGDSMETSSAGSPESASRIGFLRKQGALGVAAISTLGVPKTAGAAGLFDIGQNDKIELENVPSRIIIGQTQSIKWSTVSPSIAAMRTEARARFSKTGAKGGREVSSFSNLTPDGADVTVGLEVADAKDSSALGEGFSATVMSPPGEYMRGDHATITGMVPWATFVSRIQKRGYELSEPVSLFEVYMGKGGEGGVSMYAAVKRVIK